jgi:hypothetical protein
MSASIEFTSRPSKTFLVAVRNPANDYSSLASGIACTEIRPGRYRADLGSLVGIVWIEAVDGATRTVGFADLDNPAGNGYSDVVDEVSTKQELLAEFDNLSSQVSAITASVTSPAQVPVPPGSFNIWSGVDFSESFEVNVPSGWTRVLFTVKDGRDIDTNDDSKSVLQVQVSNPNDPSDGLTYLNKAEAEDGGLAELVVAGNRESVSLSILAEATIQLRQKKTYHWDIGVHVGTEKPYVTSPGTMTVQDVVTKTVPE